jgi:ParB-like chromosome segregation protein Spo0J
MNDQGKSIVSDAAKLFEGLNELSEEDRIEAINQIRLALHEHSPMKENPVDCVLWIKQEEVHSNSYNPNAVAPPEMALLEKSITEDGFTQPIVVWQEESGECEVIDGYHRSLVGRKMLAQGRVHGRLPITVANASRTGLADRMASTIRHNRARGSHDIDLMKDMVAGLAQCGMSDKWIMQHLGMDVDELLRLKQISGLAALFKDAEFSRSWEAVDTEI